MLATMIHEDDPQRALDVLNIVKEPLQYTVTNGNPQLADTQDAKCLVHVIDRTMEHITKKYRILPELTPCPCAIILYT